MTRPRPVYQFPSDSLNPAGMDETERMLQETLYQIYSQKQPERVDDLRQLIRLGQRPDQSDRRSDRSVLQAALPPKQPGSGPYVAFSPESVNFSGNPA